MKTFALFLIALLALPGCKQHFAWHQKLTVTVETPSGDVSGSSVTVVEIDSFPAILPDAGGVASRLTGEAVVVEVRPGRYLFALLNGAAAGWASAAYGLGGPDTTFEEDRSAIEAKIGKPAVPVPPEAWPLMVTFDDIRDPKTVRRVEPADLAASFGSGVSLKAVTLAVTEAPVTAGRVEGVLGWWLGMRSGPYNELTPLRLPNNSPRGWNHLDALAFWSLDRLQEFDRRSN